MIKDKIRIIDFSDHEVKIDENYNKMYYNMFQNFNSMVNRLNFKTLNLEDIYNRLEIPSEIKNDTNHLEEDFEYVRNQLRNLKKQKPKIKQR